MSFFVTSTEWAGTQARVAKLNKRAAKAGIAAQAVLVKLGEKQITETVEPYGFKRTYTQIQGEIQGLAAVKLGAYRLAAVIDHDPAGNVVREVPGFPAEIPAEFWTTAAARCDHCGLIRNRNETVLVWDDVEGFKQVGKQCVQMFLGVAPTALIAWLTEANGIGGDEGWGQKYGPTVSEYVAAAALATTIYGFTPTSAAIGTPTTAVVGGMLNPTPDKYFREQFPQVLNPTPEQVEKANALAAAAVEWVVNADSNGNSYLLNLGIAAKRDEVGRNGGLLASLPNAYKRAMQTEGERAAKAAAKAEQTAEAEWIGQEGEKVTVTAKVVYTNRTEPYSYYSPEGLFVILVTEAGETIYINTTVETAIGQVLEEAEAPVTLTGTVKAHKINNKGQKVTALTRCKAV